MRQALAMTTCVLLIGCGGAAMPKTAPVSGKVIDAKGAPLTAGSVRFDPKQPGDLTITSEIGPDGTFSMKTFRNRDQSAGVPPGDYEVTIIRPIVEGNNPPPPVTLPDVVSVPAGGNSALTLKLPR